MTPETKDFQFIAGVDEVGVGPLAGPVVSAAVILGENITRRNGLWRQVRDSKQLSEKKRNFLAQYIRQHALDFGIGLCTNIEVDELNILQASLLSMRRAVEGLKNRPQLILVDGRNIIPLPNPPHKGEGIKRGVFPPLDGEDRGGVVIEQRAIINGDAKILAIAAASIIAKVYRDDLMLQFAKQFPMYGFEEHKGYGTKFHLSKLAKHGPCTIHRMTFAPLRFLFSPPREEGLGEVISKE